MKNLIKFIESHGHEAWEYLGQLYGVCTYSDPIEGVVTQIEPIPANLNAVRDWLGY